MNETTITITFTDDSITLYGNNVNELSKDDIDDSIKMLASLVKSQTFFRREAARMEMRKFITEIHPDGTLTCYKYEDPQEANTDVVDRAWLDGYESGRGSCE